MLVLVCFSYFQISTMSRFCLYLTRCEGESVRYKMTSVCGHVMSIDFPGKFNNWDK